MSDGIFLVQNDGQLVEMNEQPYDSEDLLQGLLAKYPNLLAGGQFEGAEPRRWLLVKREMTIPSEVDGGGRWSVDHLFLDQDAIPTLIEVKRSSDTRIRREVVGQMLDYAANAVVYWPVEAMRSQFEKNCETSAIDPDEHIQQFLNGKSSSDEFWTTAKTNLQAGKVRMVFVADVIPPELKRIVEFLNEQMDPAEVLAVEIKQYCGQGMRTLVPRVFGQTAEAERKKVSTRSNGDPWDEDRFFEVLREKRGDEESAIARELFDWSKTKATDLGFGSGKKHGSMIPRFADRDQRLFGIRTGGLVEIPFGWMKNSPPFDDVQKRTELSRKISSVLGKGLDPGTEYPTFRLSDLKDSNMRSEFLKVLDWAYEQISR